MGKNLSPVSGCIFWAFAFQRQWAASPERQKERSDRKRLLREGCVIRGYRGLAEVEKIQADRDNTRQQAEYRERGNRLVDELSGHAQGGRSAHGPVGSRDFVYGGPGGVASIFNHGL